MKRSILVPIAAAGTLLAQSGIVPPHAGYVRDNAGTLRPVYGVAGNFMLGRPIAEGVLSAAFSGRVGLAKTASSLFAFDREGRVLGRIAAADGAAQFSFLRDGSEAVVFLFDTSQPIGWKDGQFELLSDAGQEMPTPPWRAEGEDLVLRQPNGAELRARIGGPVTSVEQMGEGWLHVLQPGRHMAVRLIEDRLEMYRLPEAAQ